DLPGVPRGVLRGRPFRRALRGSSSAVPLASPHRPPPDSDRDTGNGFHIRNGAIVKVAFVGKGGSGKTTLSSLFVRYLAERELPVVAIDADINQHLGVALGLDEDRAAKIPALGDRLTEIKEHLRGDNPRIG